MDNNAVMWSLMAVVIAFVHSCAGESASACFSPQNRTLDMDCGPGYMLHITRTFYGYSPSRQCRLVADEMPAAGGEGCIMEEQGAHYNCEGGQKCSINLPTGNYGVAVLGCGQRSNYFQVEYTCIAEVVVSDICESQQLTSQSGYIRTPSYPSNYHRQGKCSTTITAHPSQRLTLYIIDMELESRGTADCADQLYFNDKLRSITLCGSRNNNTYHMHTNFLHIELKSSSGGHSKGFWLYYEAYPPLPTSIEPPTSDAVPSEISDPDMAEADVLSNDQGDISDVTPAQVFHPRSTVPLIRTSVGSKKYDPLPFAAIAGGVIGTLSLVLLVLLLLLLVKWLKERRYNKVQKVLEIRNPAFRSSVDFYDAQYNQGSSFPASNPAKGYPDCMPSKQSLCDSNPSKQSIYTPPGPAKSKTFNNGYYC